MDCWTFLWNPSPTLAKPTQPNLTASRALASKYLQHSRTNSYLQAQKFLQENRKGSIWLGIEYPVDQHAWYKLHKTQSRDYLENGKNWKGGFRNMAGSRSGTSYNISTPLRKKSMDLYWESTSWVQIFQCLHEMSLQISVGLKYIQYLRCISPRKQGFQEKSTAIYKYSRDYCKWKFRRVVKYRSGRKYFWDYFIVKKMDWSCARGL